MELKKLLLFVLIISNFVCLYIISDLGLFNKLTLADIKEPMFLLLITIAANFIVLTIASLKDRWLAS